MKITAGQALVAFGEMKIDRADETGERTNDAKGKERDNGLRKYAGHLVVPKWKSRKGKYIQPDFARTVDAQVYKL
ncbi:hypothetical protein O988_08271 [Pseudogymnoascus sp. VKM F-3808]|nr:hypothetical protein O988_08271 [Pseudogymnoascus sp. VKM F-3808]